MTQKQIKNLKKGHTIHFPVLSPLVSDNLHPMRDIEEIAKRFKLPLKKLKYTREIYYFEHKCIKEKGWTDTAKVSYEK